MMPWQSEWMVPVRPRVASTSSPPVMARSSIIGGRPPSSGGSRGLWKGMTMIGLDRQFAWS